MQYKLLPDTWKRLFLVIECKRSLNNYQQSKLPFCRVKCDIDHTILGLMGVNHP